jgi:hypothetical protein
LATKEWDLKRAEKEWVPQTKGVQHVGVPGYQWQTAVMWDGSLGFGPFGFRKIEEFPGAEIGKYWEEIERLGESRLHLSFAYGDGMRFFDFTGTGAKEVKKGLERGNTPIPHIEMRDGVLAWEEMVYAHLLDRPVEDGMKPRPDDMLVTHAAFTVHNKGRSKRTARLWMYFGDASLVRFGYKVFVGAAPGPALAHSYEPPFGIFQGKVRYVLPEPSAGRFVVHDEAHPDQYAIGLNSVIEWQVDLAPGKSASMEIMLPYSGVDMAAAKRILKMDRGKALAETRAFWRKLVDSCDRISVPDEFVSNYAAAAPAQQAQQVAFRHTTGVWLMKTSPNHYEIY